MQITSLVLISIFISDVAMAGDLYGNRVELRPVYESGIPFQPKLDRQGSQFAYFGSQGLTIRALDGVERTLRVTDPLTVTFSFDSKRMLVGGYYQTAIYEISTGKVITQFEQSPGWPQSVGYFDEEKSALVVSEEGLRQYETKTGKLKEFKKIKVLNSEVSPSGDLVALELVPGALSLWDSHKLKLLHAFPAEPNTVNLPDGTAGYSFAEFHTIRFSHDGKRLVTTSPNQTVRVYDVGNKVELKHFTLGKSPTGVAIANRSDLIFVGTDTDQGLIIDLSSGEIVQSLSLPGVKEMGGYCGLGPAEFSADDKLLLTTAGGSFGKFPMVCGGAFMWSRIQE